MLINSKEQQNNSGILVEWAARPGRQQVSRLTDAVGDGTEALKKAFDSIEDIAEQVAERLDNMRDNQRDLSKVEVEFGLKLDAEAGAFIAKAGVEASIVVKMTWEQKDGNKSTGK